MNDLGVMEYLLEKPQIRVNDVNGDDVTALMEASKEGQKELVRLLLKHKDIDVNKVNWETSWTALFYACEKKLSVSCGIGRKFHQATNCSGCPFDEHGNYKGQRLCGGECFWHEDACLSKHLKVIELLLRCPKVDTEMFDDNGEKALIMSNNSNYEELLKSRPRLIESGHTCCSEEMKRGLQIAAKDDDEEYANALLKCTGMDVNNGYASGFTPLYIASRENNLKIVAVLLKDPDIDVNKIVGGESALLVSAEKGYIEIVKLLLSHGDIDTNINKRGNQGNALFLAATKGHTEIAKELLLQPQIEVNGAFGPREMTPLISASRKGNLEVVKLLMQCPKTDINATDALGETAFQACTNKTKEMLEINEQLTATNYTCCLDASRMLMQFAKVGNQRAVRGLAQCPNGDINMDDNKGRTPLYHATLRGHIGVVLELLALPTIEVNKGRHLDGVTPFSIASKKGHFEILRMYVLHGKIDVKQGWLNDSWSPEVKVSSCDAESDGYTSNFNGGSSMIGNYKNL